MTTLTLYYISLLCVYIVGSLYIERLGVLTGASVCIYCRIAVY